MVRPLTPGKFVETLCPNCGTAVRNYLSNPRKFCSRKCVSEFARRGNDCVVCKKPISVPASHGRKFCSKACRGVSLRLESGQALRNEAVASYKRHAATRGLAWALTDDQIDLLFARDCHWCGDPPSNRRFRERSYGEFVYNGIDRVDNERPYEPSNCVPCCFTCNSMKRDFTPSLFINKATKIARRHTCA